MHSIELVHPSRRHGHGFTLVEMLVVIAIMSILMTAGAIGLNGLGGKGVTSGVASAESLFDEARATAIGRNMRTCVLVAKTLTNNPGDELRRILIATEQVDTTANSPTFGQAKDPNNNDPNWELTSRGAQLPEQTYYSQTLSKKVHKADSAGGGPVDTIQSSKIVGVKPAFVGEYYIYRFNSQGICSTPGASFVIGTGSKPPTTNTKPKVTTAAKRDFGGFVVWRNGTTSIFHSPEQMGKSTISGLNPGDTF